MGMGQMCLQYLLKAAVLVTLSLLSSNQFQVILCCALLCQQAPGTQSVCTILQRIWYLAQKNSPLTVHLNAILLFPHRP